MYSSTHLLKAWMSWAEQSLSQQHSTSHPLAVRSQVHSARSEIKSTFVTSNHTLEFLVINWIIWAHDVISWVVQFKYIGRRKGKINLGGPKTFLVDSFYICLTPLTYSCCIAHFSHNLKNGPICVLSTVWTHSTLIPVLLLYLLLDPPLPFLPQLNFSLTPSWSIQFLILPYVPPWIS